MKYLILIFISFVSFQSCTHGNHYSIQGIDYQTGPCFGSCPVFHLIINSEKKATLNARRVVPIYSKDSLTEDEKMEGSYHTTIDSIHFSAIVNMLHDIDFVHLDSYDITVADAPDCTLIINYDNGKIKRIYDGGQNGTLGLRQLYGLLSDLRKNQHWVKD